MEAVNWFESWSEVNGCKWRSNREVYLFETVLELGEDVRHGA